MVVIPRAQIVAAMALRASQWTGLSSYKKIIDQVYSLRHLHQYRPYRHAQILDSMFTHVTFLLLFLNVMLLSVMGIQLINNWNTLKRYSSRWYAFSIKSRILISVLLYRSLIPCTLTAGKMFVMSMTMCSSSAFCSLGTFFSPFALSLASLKLSLDSSEQVSLLLWDGCAMVTRGVTLTTVFASGDIDVLFSAERGWSRSGLSARRSSGEPGSADFGRPYPFF
ncbi:hypothetical protein DBV15_08656 [Temnothorax longispinosus]|uniref:Uncharacterized protein n=1 Tax=Temnothorax longispinosus TaxID=300112 RepID=A0A4S2KFY3_9HYME|nr:hypothetical protein DBV15_08656 [Temnothorax longispinosus]